MNKLTKVKMIVKNVIYFLCVKFKLVSLRYIIIILRVFKVNLLKTRVKVNGDL